MRSPNNTIFADGQSPGFTDYAVIRTNNPVNLTDFRILLGQDGIGSTNRSADAVRLYASANGVNYQLISQASNLSSGNVDPNNGNTGYAYTGNDAWLTVSETFSTAVSAQFFRIEVDRHGSLGARIFEIDGFGSIDTTAPPPGTATVTPGFVGAVADDLFDPSQGAAIVGSATYNSDFGIKKMTDGAAGASETNHTIFADGQPAGTTDYAIVRTAAPAQLTGYRLTLGQDSLNDSNRSADAIRVFGSMDGITYTLLSSATNLTAGQSAGYGYRFGSNTITISETLASPISAQFFKLEIDRHGTNGVRVMEFDGFGTQGIGSNRLKENLFNSNTNVLANGDDAPGLVDSVATSSAFPGFNVADAFGHVSSQYEPGHFVFADVTTGDSLSWTTTQAITLTGYRIGLIPDGDTTFRGSGRVRLYAGIGEADTLIDEFENGAMSGVISRLLASEFTADHFRLEIVRTSAGGPRVTEFDAIVRAASWTGLGDGFNWSDPANWDGTELPDSSSSVYIGSTFNVQIGAETTGECYDLVCEGSLEILGVLTIRNDSRIGGSISLDGSLTVQSGAFVIEGGGNFDGNLNLLTLDASFVVSDGLLQVGQNAIVQGEGRTVVGDGGNAELVVAPGPNQMIVPRLTLNAGGTIRGGGAMQIIRNGVLQGGQVRQVDIRVATTATASFGGGVIITDATITNSSPSATIDGDITLENQAGFINTGTLLLTSGQVLDVNPQAIAGGVVSSTFANTGSLKKLTTGHFAVFSKFRNEGVMEVQEGALGMNADSDYGGQITIANSAQMELTNGIFNDAVHFVRQGAFSSGTGSILLEGARLVVLRLAADTRVDVRSITIGSHVEGNANAEIHANSIDWISGNISRCTLLVGVNDSMTIGDRPGAAAVRRLAHSTILNHGTVTWDDEVDVNFFGDALLECDGVNGKGILNFGSNQTARFVADPAIPAATATIGFVNGAKMLCLPGAAASTIDNIDFRLISGTLLVSASHLVLTKAWTNFGTVEVGSGGRLEMPAAFRQSGTLRLSGGTLAAVSVINHAGFGNAEITGYGTLEGNVENRGVLNLNAGTGPAALRITGDFTQFASGKIDLVINGPQAGSFSALTVTGNANLAGTLSLSSTNGYAPNAPTRIPVLVSALVSGTFDTLASTFPWTLDYVDITQVALLH